MAEVSSKLSAMTDLNLQLRQLQTKHEMTAQQNADMLIKLQVLPLPTPCLATQRHLTVMLRVQPLSAAPWVLAC